jgi:hypothetical protein
LRAAAVRVMTACVVVVSQSSMAVREFKVTDFTIFGLWLWDGNLFERVVDLSWLPVDFLD